MTGGRLVRALVAVLLVAGTASCSNDGAATPAEVPECADLRARENVLIDSVNETLAAVGDTDDETERAIVLVDGFDDLIDLARSHIEGIASSDPALEEALRAGGRAAVDQLASERDEFAASVPVVTEDDERGRVGEFQNALEKAFSNLEPARSVYVDAGLGDAIDADPTCEFVTQRADPAD